MDWRPLSFFDDGSVSIPDNWLYSHYYEALNLLFRIENTLRVFVYIVLKTAHKENWDTLNLQDDETGGGTIGSIGKRRLSQANAFGYLGYVTPCHVMYLTTGELIQIILSDNQWALFTRYFPRKERGCSK